MNMEGEPYLWESSLASLLGMTMCVTRWDRACEAVGLGQSLQSHCGPGTFVGMSKISCRNRSWKEGEGCVRGPALLLLLNGGRHWLCFHQGC